MELIDTSVWARKSNSHIREWFTTALIEGEIAVCDMVVLEILSGANSPLLLAETRVDLDGVPWLRMGTEEWRRAVEVCALLEMESGTNIRRSVKIPDLLIAACAERHGLTLVHYDAHYERIAEVTGQPVRWVADRGQL